MLVEEFDELREIRQRSPRGGRPRRAAINKRERQGACCSSTGCTTMLMSSADFHLSSGPSLATWWRFTIMPTGPGQKAPGDELLASGRWRMVGCARSLVSLA